MSLYIFRGLPGSGKSFLARDVQSTHGGRVVERDEIRYMLFGKYHDVDEKLVTEVQNMLIDQGLRMQENVYVSDMNLRNQYVTRLVEKAVAHGVDYKIIDLTDIPLQTCILRNEKRIKEGKRGVPNDLIRDLHQRFIRGREYPLPVTFKDVTIPSKGAQRMSYTPDITKPEAIIVDIDGTLARMVDRGPFDEHLVLNDELIMPVSRMVENAAMNDVAIVFMSGRTDGCYDDTKKWLMDKLYFLTWGFGGVQDFRWELHMRRSVEDRGRPDDDVKYDLFMREVAHRFNVLYVIDDRDKVVKMWREIGLTCAQVAEGDF